MHISVIKAKTGRKEKKRKEKKKEAMR